MHHLVSWIKIDQLDATYFIISLFTAQHVSNVSTSIFRSLRLIVVDLFRLKQSFSLNKGTTPPQPNHTVIPTHIEPEQYNTWNKSTVSRKLLKMDVLTFETCWAVNSEIIKQVTSSWSIFIQLRYIMLLYRWDPIVHNVNHSQCKPWDLISTATLYKLIDTNLCKPDDGQARPKHIADVTSCRIQLSIVLCKDGLIQYNLSSRKYLA